MTQNHFNTKKSKFTHLIDIERGQITAYLQEDLSYRETGRRIGRDPSHLK